jgi:hypothetical protein
MKRLWIILYVTFCGCLVLALVAMLVRVIYPEFPNTPTSKHSLHKQLGIEVSTVEDIYHDYSFPDFHGDDGHYFRFRYPNAKWIEEFKSRYDAVRLEKIAGGLGPQNLRWWDWNKCSAVESYRLNGTGYSGEFLWVDTDRRLAYINIYNW